MAFILYKQQLTSITELNVTLFFSDFVMYLKIVLQKERKGGLPSTLSSLNGLKAETVGREVIFHTKSIANKS